MTRIDSLLRLSLDTSWSCEENCDSCSKNLLWVLSHDDIHQFSQIPLIFLFFYFQVFRSPAAFPTFLATFPTPSHRISFAICEGIEFYLIRRARDSKHFFPSKISLSSLTQKSFYEITDELHEKSINSACDPILVKIISDSVNQTHPMNTQRLSIEIWRESDSLLIIERFWRMRNIFIQMFGETFCEFKSKVSHSVGD